MGEIGKIKEEGPGLQESFSVSAYVRAMKSELQRVNWPDSRVAIRLSVVILCITVFSAVFVALFDYISAEIVLVLDSVF